MIEFIIHAHRIDDRKGCYYVTVDETDHSYCLTKHLLLSEAIPLNKLNTVISQVTQRAGGLVDVIAIPLDNRHLTERQRKIINV